VLERVLDLGAATFVLAVLATTPAYDEGGTTLTLAVLATVALAAAVTSLVPRPWAAAGLAVTVPGSVYLALQLMVLGAHAARRYADTAAAEWAGTTGGRLGQLSLEREQAAAWTLPLLVLVLVGAAWSALRLTTHGRAPGAHDRETHHLLLGAGGLTAASVAATLLLHPVPVWAVLLVLLTAGAVAVELGLRTAPGTGSAALAVGAVTLAAALPLSWYDAWLTLVALAVTLLAAGAVQLRSRLDAPALVACAVLPPLVGGLVWTVGELAGRST
jgi:hypothetical protein